MAKWGGEIFPSDAKGWSGTLVPLYSASGETIFKVEITSEIQLCWNASVNMASCAVFMAAAFVSHLAFLLPSLLCFITI